MVFSFIQLCCKFIFNKKESYFGTLQVSISVGSLHVQSFPFFTKLYTSFKIMFHLNCLPYMLNENEI